MNKIETAVIVVQVQPSAKNDEWVGLMANHVLKIKLKAKPVSGMANASLVEFLSKYLKVKKRDLEIIAGQKSRMKKIKVFGKGQKDLNLLLEKMSNGHP